MSLRRQVELFYSRQFYDREEGLQQLAAMLGDTTVDADAASSDTATHAATDAERSAAAAAAAQRNQRLLTIGVNKIARSATLLLHRTVRDAVYSVFSAACETVRALFVYFVPGRVAAGEVARCVDRLLPELLSKCGDPSPRIHTLAQHTILSIAACPEVRYGVSAA